MRPVSIVHRNYRPCINKDGSSLLMYQICHQNRTTLISTGISVLPENWDKKRQEVRRSVENSSNINTLLMKGKSQLENIALEAKIKGIEPSPSYIKDQYKKKCKNANEVHVSFDLFIKQFIKNSDKTTLTKKSYNNTYNHLINYQKHRKITLEFDSINIGFYDDFKRYLFSKNVKAVNTFGSIIKNIKVFMNASLDLKHHKNLEFRHRKFKVLSEETDSIYLNEEELNRIFLIDFSGNRRLGNVRDLFYIGCYTGLRFSDFSQLKKENFRGNFIHITTQKTNQKVVIPLHPNVIEIMNRYKHESLNSLPESISNQKMNNYLKEVGKLAELNNSVTIVKSLNGIRKAREFKKHELLTTHCARRSFATNLFLQGFPSINIMKITGHKTEKAFLKYIKVTQEQAADLLKKHWEKQNPA